MTYPTHRTASPQAWRRLRSAMTDGELMDVAEDIANYMAADDLSDSMPFQAASIKAALTDYPWERKHQR